MMLSCRRITNLLPGKFGLVRGVLTTAKPPQHWPENAIKINYAALHSRLFEVGSTGQRVTDVLHSLTANGFKLDNADLLFCLKKLRQYHRYNDCLEAAYIRFPLSRRLPELLRHWGRSLNGWRRVQFTSETNHALRLNLIFNLKGIDEAESYFFDLPPEEKKPAIYGTLLNCYCISMRPVKALALFRKMDEMNCVSNSLNYDNLMSLHMKIGQPEMVYRLVEEMKQRNIRLSNVSYHILLQSCGELKDLWGLEQVMAEVQKRVFGN